MRKILKSFVTPFIRLIWRIFTSTALVWVALPLKSWATFCRYVDLFLLAANNFGYPNCEKQFEADRRAINITINSFGTELTKDQREALYPNFGLLYPEGTMRLAKADDLEQVRAIIEAFGVHSFLPYFLCF